MKYLIKIILTILSVHFFFSCNQEDDPVISSEENQQTVLLFFPWSTNLLSYFNQNIRDFEECIINRGLNSERVVVCISNSPTTATIFELKLKNNECVRDTVLNLEDISFSKRNDLYELFRNIQNIAPAKRYGMIIGCHGMGWLPIITSKVGLESDQLNYINENIPLTRYFGGLSSEYQIETKVLSEVIKESGLYFEYILFDDCYMSSIEVAFDLKDVTNYIIGCPTEVLVYGFPYHLCGKYLLGIVNYESVIDSFYYFYSQYPFPYGTAAVTNCQEIDSLSNIIKAINLNENNHIYKDNIQIMDGYDPTIFYDFKDYVVNKCKDVELLNEFLEQLDKVVPYKCHTEYYYSARSGAIKISNFSGITTSELSNNKLTDSYYETGWFKATH